MKKKTDDFSNSSQISARKTGQYDRIAREVETSGRCVFCNLKAKYIIEEQDGWVLTVNIFPRSTGDMIIIPKKHIEKYQQLNTEDHIIVSRLNCLGMELLSSLLGIKSFYLMIREGENTDKTVRHLHFQILHYWKGLIDWHPQEDILPPIELAKGLKSGLRSKKNGPG